MGDGTSGHLDEVYDKVRNDNIWPDDITTQLTLI